MGGIVGALVGMGIPEYEAKRFEGAVKGGGTLLSVHCDTSEQVSAGQAGSGGDGRASDVASASEEGSATSDTSGGRGTFGNISDRDDRDDVTTDRSVVGTRPDTLGSGGVTGRSYETDRVDADDRYGPTTGDRF